MFTSAMISIVEYCLDRLLSGMYERSNLGIQKRSVNLFGLSITSFWFARQTRLNQFPNSSKGDPPRISWLIWGVKRRLVSAGYRSSPQLQARSARRRPKLGVILCLRFGPGRPGGGCGVWDRRDGPSCPRECGGRSGRTQFVHCVGGVGRPSNTSHQFVLRNKIDTAHETAAQNLWTAHIAIG